MSGAQITTRYPSVGSATITTAFNDITAYVPKLAAYNTARNVYYFFIIRMHIQLSIQI
jgi:hypothetical protein